jgi:acylphosphatase
VQGVWFRASTQQQAERLRLHGTVHNRPDGSVEVVACGEAMALQTLREWLWQGPTHAQVEAVECEPLQRVQIPSGFIIGR